MLRITYSDPNLPESVNSGMARLRDCDWQSGTQESQVRDWRAVCALKAILIGHLFGSADYESNPDGTTAVSLAGDMTLTGERADAARALLSPLTYYYNAADLEPLSSQGEIYLTAPNELGLWPLAVIVTVAIAGTAIIGWGMQKATELTKFFAAQKAQLSEIQRLDAKVTDLVNGHVQAEVKSGTPIPMSDAEKLQFETLNQRIRQLQSQLEPEKTASPAVPWWAWLILGAGVAGVGAGALMQRHSPARQAA
jgi:hypothetical protein